MLNRPVVGAIVVHKNCPGTAYKVTGYRNDIGTVLIQYQHGRVGMMEATYRGRSWTAAVMNLLYTYPSYLALPLGT